MQNLEYIEPTHFRIRIQRPMTESKARQNMKFPIINHIAKYKLLIVHNLSPLAYYLQTDKLTFYNLNICRTIN